MARATTAAENDGSIDQKAKAGAIKDGQIRSRFKAGAPDCRAAMVDCTWPTALVDLLHIAHSNTL